MDCDWPAFELGEPIRNFGVGVVVRSENPTFNAGDHVYGILPFEEYSVRAQVEGLSKIENKHSLPWTVFVGTAGMPGRTAYCGWKEYAQAKKGEVAFTTTDAGAVGSFVVQLAKREGMKVIVSVGSDEKVAFMKEIGVDVVFNYKTTKTSEGPRRRVQSTYRYWDNVGGEALEAALGAAAQHAHFIDRGMISEYNVKPYPVMNLMNIVMQEINVHGLLVLSFLPKYGDASYAEVPALIASGKLKAREEDISKGLEKVGEAILAVQKGTNKGMCVIVVAIQ